MYKICDELCFQSKNVYNQCNYIIRQEFFNSKTILKYCDLNKILKSTECFKQLGSNSAQMVTKQVCQNWKSFLVGVSDYSKNSSKYLGKPKIPSYKSKDGRNICTLTNMQTQIKDNYLFFAFKRMKPFNNLIRTNIKGHHLSTRIIPRGSCYILEIVYEKEYTYDYNLDKNRKVSIDLGLNNFATVVNNIGVTPIVINGRGIKSYNCYWNKRISKLKSIAKIVNDLDWTKQLQLLTNKRYFKMEHFMHCASKWIIDYCVYNDIGTIVIGHNKEWKQNCNLHSISNQQFVQIPYNQFINKLKYKCEDYNIDFYETEESYTSGTSFLDNEQPIKSNYNKNRRISRGLFRSNNNILINADVNGAYQIMKKVFPKEFSDGILGLHLHPSIIDI